MQQTITVSTNKRNGLYDITDDVRKILKASKVRNGLINIYVRHATAAIMIQENWDESVQNDVVTLLSSLIPKGVWEHDAQDGNGDAHLKSGWIGPSETVPIVDGNLALGRWQNIFLCEFDGPRKDRQVLITILPDLT
ncbi:secondary thiamine-phosphate synthase enzyme YjbQ [bacterium]|nr:secondary thiamine-phosphate synthase enzyme YjbQ [bacterium]